VAWIPLVLTFSNCGSQNPINPIAPEMVLVGTIEFAAQAFSFEVTQPNEIRQFDSNAIEWGRLSNHSIGNRHAFLA